MHAFLGLLFTAALASVARADIQSSCKANGKFALTFDDGPAEFTGQLLSILKSKNATATFHLTTQNLTDPDVQGMVKKIASAGHLIGIRTEPTWDLARMSDDQLKSAIARQSAILSQFIGYYPKFVRLPYDMKDPRVIKAIESTGAIVTRHNLESYDYTKNSDKIISAFKLSLSLKPASSYSLISVQHDAIKESVTSTGAIIDLIRKSGYKLVTLDDCISGSSARGNKSPLKGGSGKAEDLPTLGGGASGSVGGGDDDSSSSSGASDDGKKKKSGFLRGLGNSAASGAEPAAAALTIAGLMLIGLITV